MASTQEPEAEEKPKNEEKGHLIIKAEYAAKWEEFWRLLFEFASKPDSANEADRNEKGNGKAG
jgi:hypothetical protein